MARQLRHEHDFLLSTDQVGREGVPQHVGGEVLDVPFGQRLWPSICPRIGDIRYQHSAKGR